MKTSCIELRFHQKIFLQSRWVCEAVFDASLRVLLGVLLLAAVFVIVTSLELPPVVASHFALGGIANGFMSRQGYVVFMLIMMVGLVVVFELTTRALRLFPARSFNLPNRDYWLAPERRDETLRNIERGALVRGRGYRLYHLRALPCGPGECRGAANAAGTRVCNRAGMLCNCRSGMDGGVHWLFLAGAGLTKGSIGSVSIDFCEI